MLCVTTYYNKSIWTHSVLYARSVCVIITGGGVCKYIENEMKFLFFFYAYINNGAVRRSSRVSDHPNKMKNSFIRAFPPVYRCNVRVAYFFDNSPPLIRRNRANGTWKRSVTTDEKHSLTFLLYIYIYIVISFI